MRKRRKRSQRQILHDKAWEIQSIYIRQSGGEYTQCYTCLKSYHWKLLQAGHWKHGICDFESWNIRPQCVQCNRWMSGMRDTFMRNLQREYGVEQLDRLEAEGQKRGNRYSVEELEKIIRVYKGKLDKLSTTQFV